MKSYDYLIIGAGLFGCVFAQKMSQHGKKCLLIEKRDTVGGNCATEYTNDIYIHKYGSHVFHTDNLDIWKYVNKFDIFNPFINRVKAVCNKKIYLLPINLMTLNQIWGVSTPKEAMKLIGEKKLKIENPKNAEEYLLSTIGEELTGIFYRGYTEKQWGLPLSTLPVSTYKRLPIRFNFDDNFYNHLYQGIPENGYTYLCMNMIKKCDLNFQTNYFANRQMYNNLANKIVYTGPIDKFFNYKYGYLKYISINFKYETLPVNDQQGCAVISYPTRDVEYTKSIEHKHFMAQCKNNKTTIIHKEYPIQNTTVESHEPFYPINNDENNKIYDQYLNESRQLKNFIFGGRLAEYKYYDMHDVIKNAIHVANNEMWKI